MIGTLLEGSIPNIFSAVEIIKSALKYEDAEEIKCIDPLFSNIEKFRLQKRLAEIEYKQIKNSK